MDLRLACSQFWVDVRLRQVGGCWLPSADTPDGPTLGWADGPMDALFAALDPYRDVRAELLASIEHEETLR